MPVLPFGTWPSPVDPASLVAGEVVLDEVRPDGDATWWLERRPSEEGRVVLVRHDASGTHDVLPAPWSVRTRVHEYGGGAYAVDHGTVVFSNLADGRLWRLDPGADEPVALTPDDGWRYGGVVVRGGQVFAVREDHHRDGEPANELVRLALDGRGDDAGTVLWSWSDFVGRPAVSPDGSSVAWVEWDHPNMPWDTTRLRRARLTAAGVEDVAVVAGTDGVSVGQPVFGPDGSLWFVSDASGWWTVQRDSGSGPVAVHDVSADHMTPQWSLGMVELAVVDDDRALVRWWEPGASRLGVLDARTGDTTPIDVEGVTFDHLHVEGGDLVARRGLADRLPEVVRGPLGGDVRVLATAGDPPLSPDDVSVARPWTWTDSAGLEAHGLLYEPRLSGHEGPEGERPPLLVMVHGGPTARAEPTFATATQLWTSRGWAVLDVNHSGSTGFGRAYRDRLRGSWGVIDIDDTVSGARSLAAAGVVDGDRLAITGGSAGGYSVLRCMTTSDAFAAGTSYFGVADLTALAEHTHKFESRYLDSLVAPLPEGAAVYRERSPLHHADRLHGELLLLQGEDDLVVPLAQAEAMAGAMRDAGRDVELVVYPGEGHGFRQGSVIIDSLTRELAFYARVMGWAEPSA